MKHSLDGKLDDLIDDLIEGRTFRELSAMYGVQVSTIHEYLNKPENIERYALALKTSSDSYAEKAENVLLDAKSKLVEIQRARELAQHYRWMASKRNPKKYGDKLDVTSGGEPVQKADLSTIPSDVLKALINANRDKDTEEPG